MKLSKTKIAVVGGTLVVMAAIVFLAHLSQAARPPVIPSYLGNRPEVVSLLSEPASRNPFRFVVMGDIEDQPGRYGRILERAVEDKAAFIIVAGDLVNTNREERWKFFIKEVKQKLDGAHPSVAFFSAPGNHDVEPGNKGLGFDQVMGARQFYFLYRGSLFIMLDSSSGSLSPASYEWLQEVLARERPRAEHAFLFLHYPAITFPGFPTKSESRAQWEALYEPLRNLAERYRVEYVFSGHYHGYYQETRAGVTYIITGGGGAHLRQPGGKHHFMQLVVSDQEVKVTKVDIPSWPKVRDEIEGFFWLEVVPFFGRLVGR